MEPTLRFLVVDDELINRMLCEKLLSGIGCEVDSAEDGPTAIGLLSENRYDAVVIDYLMPGMDGVQTRIQSTVLGLDPEPKWILFTAMESADAGRIAKESRFDGVIVKPIDRYAVEAWVKRLRADYSSAA